METRGLSEEEQYVWDSLVAKGREVRAPVQERKAREREENQRRMAIAHGRDPDEAVGWKSRAKRSGVVSGVYEVPVQVKRFVVCRASGMSFGQAGSESGCRWTDVQMARMKSEEMMCAIEGMEDSSRFLLRMKAMSVLEQSQDEGARVSMAQVQTATMLLSKLDSGNFGDDVGKRSVADEVRKELGNGGFVVNLIADATKAAGEAPKERPKRALVYTDV